MKCFIYARYSSDNQSDKSTEDQIHDCRVHATREGWTVVDTFSDHAISGREFYKRQSLLELLSKIQERSVGMVLVESLDRLSRDIEDLAHIYKLCRFNNVKIYALGDGEVSEIHLGLKGTMASLYLADLSQKTSRGLHGRAREGKVSGGKAYGYRVSRKEGSGPGDGEIVEGEAAVIRRIFSEYVAGVHLPQ